MHPQKGVEYMSVLPVRQGRLDDPDFHEAFRWFLHWALLDFVTSPSGGGYGSQDPELFERFQKEAQLPIGDVQVQDLFVRLCQDIRLTPDEIDELRSKWFS